MPVLDWATIQNPVSLVLALVLGFFINGAWPEEWGWRGFALQRSQFDGPLFPDV
jgi:hypothetical protein